MCICWVMLRICTGRVWSSLNNDYQGTGMPLGGSSLLSVPDTPFVLSGITGFRA